MSTLGLIVRRALLSGLLGVLVCAAPASAQIPDPVSPPTRGALYQDGQTGRYLLGGTWLFRADPQAVGEAAGWPSSTSTDGWSTVSVPSAWNAGDYSAASNAGSVGWYR